MTGLSVEQLVAIEHAVRTHCRYNFMADRVRRLPEVRYINGAVLVFFAQNEQGYNTLDAPQVTLHLGEKRITCYGLDVPNQAHMNAFRYKLKAILNQCS